MSNKKKKKRFYISQLLFFCIRKYRKSSEKISRDVVIHSLFSDLQRVINDLFTISTTMSAFRAEVIKIEQNFRKIKFSNKKLTSFKKKSDDCNSQKKKKTIKTNLTKFLSIINLLLSIINNLSSIEKISTDVKKKNCV